MSELLHDTNFWVAVSFVVFAIIAIKAGYAKVINGLDDKIETIRKDLQEAETLRVEAQELLAHYRRKQKEALAEAEDIIAHAQKHADSITAQAQEQLEDVAARREKQLQERLKRIEEAAIQDVKAYAATLSVDTARDLIYSNMDKKKNGALVEKTNETLSKLAG